LLYTAAAQTVQAQLTQAVQPLVTAATSTPITLPTLPVSPTGPAAATPTASLSPTVSPPAVTPTPLPCDRVKFVTDVTIPDNTTVDPGETFVKTWRLQNAGSCTWTSAYALVVEGDNLFSAPPVSPLTAGGVSPGGTVDVSVTLTAPAIAGTQRGNFKLANASGVRFGLAGGNKPFWAQVKVVVPSGIVFDFIARASQAEWKSGTPGDLSIPLVFGGADDDPNGVAKIKEGVLLETGSLSGKILLTIPKHVDQGAIAGTFPPHLVQAGDRLRARLGFLIPSIGLCGAGKVRFQVAYLESGVTQALGEWQKTCDGKLLAIDMDLSSLKGKTIQIIFLVKADGAFCETCFAEDWAIWNSPRIER
jgi:hypothetical protein